MIVSYRNRAAATCTMRGYPAVTLDGRGGHQLADATRATDQPPRTVSLAPGGRVYGLVTYGETPVPARRRCPSVRSLRILAPDNRTASGVPVRNAGHYCAGARVHPVTVDRHPAL